MILVTGATGTVGREVVRLLLERDRGAAAVTRNPDAAQLPAGARTVAGDPSRPDSLAELPELDAILISPRAVGRGAAELLKTASAHGARRVVVLSAATVQHPAGHRRFAEEFRAVEDAAEASGLAWTHLRCADFAANSLAWAPQIRAAEAVRAAFGEATTAPVHQLDLAEVAVRALTASEHEGHAYVLTGPQLLSQRDRLQIIGRATGRDLAFHEVPPEGVRRAMLAQGLPEDVPERLLGSLADYAQAPGPQTDTVEQLLGRGALGFDRWARENAAAFG
jgi:uncharacterized protein YbjT (DUF2867 family)